MPRRHLRRVVCCTAALLIVSACGHEPTEPDVPPHPSFATTGTAPAAPSNPTADPVSDTQIRVGWQDNSSDEGWFEIQRSTTGPAGPWKSIKWVTSNITHFYDSGLTPATQYCYRVRANGKNGAPSSAWTSAVCATTEGGSGGGTAPAAPSNLQTAAAGASQINLSWTDNSSDEAGFEVWRSTTGQSGTYSLLTTLAAGATTYSNTALSASTQYCYEVRAIGASGAPASAFSNTSCATTAASSGAPAAPSSLVASAASSSQINLSWTDNSSNETGFEIWRSTTGQNGTYSSLATVGANVRTYSNTGLSASTQYCYQVRASGSTPSAFSNSSCATTSGGGSGGSGAASNLTATARTYREVDLTWQNNSSSVTTNEVWRSTTGISGSYTAIAWLSGTRQTYQNMSLTQNKQYCYKIKALTSSGSLGFSDPTCATTPNLDPSSVRVVTFGDSNTDRCNDPVPASDLGSYVSRVPRLAFDDPNLSCQVAGHIESRWSQSHSNAITAVNHGITATTTGGGSFGGPNRTSSSAPNARTVVNNVTRFAGEVLGDAYPWSGGESYNTSFPNGPIKRWNAFPPRTSNDFVYVALGTNDVASGMTTAQTLANLTWMVDQWTGRGLPASHFIIATLPPRTDGNFGAQISAINDGIRSLASNRGLRLVDLAAFTSNDNGVTWKDNSLQVGDGVHYVDSVRDWIAGQIVSLIAPLVS